jgi:hypothetical protein
MRGSIEWVPLFCYHCGADGGLATRETLNALGNFAHYVCDDCDEKLGPTIPGHYKVPMEVYWQKVAEAMLENDGKYLTVDEIREKLSDPNSYLSKLERDVPKLL